ncbi:unnamed protein product [Rotaria sp. Silwood2]|nr:unnamed protein product [Rotaria sp. Silwood2]
MTMDEFSIIKKHIGRLISINSFFSTTEYYPVARIFAGFSEQNKPPDRISVLFQIEIDDVIHSLKRPFASIREFSKIKDEDEILFSVGTIFRVVHVINEPESNQDWYVRLKLVNDNDDNEITEFQNELEQEFCTNCDLYSLGSVLIKMGDYDKAQRYFHIILEHATRNQAIIPSVYTYLGIIYNYKGNYQQALEYCTERNHLYHYDDEIGQTYTHIGSNYNQLGNNQLALDYFQRSLDIDENVLKLHKYNPTLATNYNNIGEIYVKLGDYEKASKTLEYALNVRLKGIVSAHTDLAAIYNNLGNAYFQRNCLEKALEIDTKTLHEYHPNLAVAHNNIASIYSRNGNLTEALYHQEKAVTIMLKSDAKNNAA